MLTVLGAVLVVVPWLAARRTLVAPGGGTGGASVRAATGPPLDAVLLLELVDAAVASGASLPRALRAVGAAAGGACGGALDAAGAALVLGASWPAAWAGAPPDVHDVRDCLEQAWVSGAAPGPALRARAAAVRRERRRRARTAGAALGVHLVLPLGLCFLPAFALLGLAPLVLGLGAGLLDGVLP
ncbi:type II secretion system F family protein [Cellulomonas palmilytica]|nr:type II secretion system F family protein [Cellulomonas palmilytica]